MARICPVCNKESPDEARYCFDPNCLSPLDPAAEAPPPPLTPPREDGMWYPGDIVAYRCQDCLDRWDIVLEDDAYDDED